MRSPKTRFPIILAVIVLISFAVYWPALRGEFLLWDDDVHVLENITIRGLDLEHVQDMFTTTVNKIYIPLTSLSFALEYHFFGYNPFVYHLDNVLLHLLVVVMVFFVGQKLGLSQAAAGVAALIFGIHPIHVESVAWITERKDVLYAVFYMAALLSYLRYLEEKSGYWLLATTMLGALSMLAKPMALSLPLVLILFDWFKGRPLKAQAFLEKLPLLIMIGAIAWVSYAAHARIPGKSIVQSALIWPWTFTFYPRQFFFPFFSVPLYRLPKPVTLANPEFLLSLVVFILVILAVVRLRRHKWFVFAVLFYFLSIFFLLRFDETKDVNVVADRYMYLPSLGLCLLLGLGVERLWRACDGKNLARGMIAAGFIVLAAIFSLKTFQQCYVWRDSMSLWRHDLSYFPDEPLALNNFAITVGKGKEFEEAQKEYKKMMRSGLAGVQKGLAPETVEGIRKVDYLIGLYQKAIQAEPGFMDVHYNLGNLYAAVGRFPEAVAMYNQALLIDPKFKDAHCGAGDVYAEVGDAAPAVFAYTQAINLYPDDEELYVHVVMAYNRALKKNPEKSLYQEARKETMRRYAQLVNARSPRALSYFNLGLVYADMGDDEGAVLAYRRVLELNPNHAAALYNLGNVYKKQGQLTQALALYQKAVGANPRISDAWLNIGVIYGGQGKEALAREYYQKALEADPKNARAYFNLAFLEESAGNLQKAVGLYQKSIIYDTTSAEGYYNLGNIFIKINKNKDALAAYLKAVDLNPGHVDAWVNLSILSFREGDFTNAVKYCDEAVALGYDAPQEYLSTLAPYRKLAGGD